LQHFFTIQAYTDLKALQKWLYPLSLRERVGVRDSGCPAVAGVPPPSLLPKGGGTKQITFSVYHIECPAKERLPHA